MYLTLLISEIKVYTHLREALFGQREFFTTQSNNLIIAGKAKSRPL